MSIEYAEDRELTRMVGRLVQEFPEFAGLRENNVLILCEMKINVDEKGENKPCKGPPATCKKIGAAERVYIKDNAHYLLLMDFTTWNDGNETERERAVHTSLKKIKAEKDKEGNLKLSTNAPEVVTYYDTARRYGNTMEELATVHQCVAHSRLAVQLVKQLEDKTQAEANGEPAPAPKAKAKSAPIEKSPEPAEDAAPEPAEDAAPEPAEEPPPMEEEVLPPPRRVNKRVSS